LRNTSANRALVRSAPAVFAAAYPAPAPDAYRSLTQSAGAFPGAALLWMDLEGGRARLLAAPPSGISVGR